MTRFPLHLRYVLRVYRRSPLVILSLLSACSNGASPENMLGADGGALGSDGDPTSGADAMPDAFGNFTVLTYNVAGLPQGVSGGNPAANTPLISPLLNSFELVLVQEDFSYHNELAADAEHSYKSDPMMAGSVTDLGDGLNRLTDFAFVGFERVKWEECNGFVTDENDCLTSKGFSYARHTIATGVEVDVYNLHADAGRADGDIDVREEQVDQLLEAIATRSSGYAVIVAGDTNMKWDDDQDALETLLMEAGLKDACVTLDCPKAKLIDRIMFRSSAAVEFTVSNWRRDEAFVDGQGEPLSDHDALAVDFAWVAQ